MNSRQRMMQRSYYRLRSTHGQERAIPLLPIARHRSADAWRAAAMVLVVTCLLPACGNIEPWVKPYERQALADPLMSFDANPVSSAYMNHVYEAREGARGALGSAGGGCGCN